MATMAHADQHAPSPTTAEEEAEAAMVAAVAAAATAPAAVLGGLRKASPTVGSVH